MGETLSLLMLKNRRSKNQPRSKGHSLGKKLGSSRSESTKKETVGYKVAKAVISRRSQNGRVILMNTYKAISFYKIEGIAAEVWKCFESAQMVSALAEHMVDLFPKRKKTLGKEVEAFVKELVKLELLVAVSGPFEEKFPALLPEALKLEQFGGIQEFDLEKIETEVLNESLYLDVFAGSDLQLKTDVIPIQNALSKVLRLDGITHKWKKDLPVKNPNRRRAGLIAQQVAVEMPELVRRDVSGVMAVDYQKFVSYLVESIKDLNRIILKQEIRIQKLESNLN